MLLTAVTLTAWRVANEQLGQPPLDAATKTTTTAQGVVSPRDRRCQQHELAATDLSGQDLSRKNFREANMTRANSTGTPVINAVLHKANLTQATLH